jgi:alpha-L-arabinofuranosidase
VNGLYFADAFNTFLRHARYMYLTENCSLINVQGMLEVNPVSLKLTPPYMAYLLYTNHTGADVVNSETNSPPVEFNPKLPMLDVAVTRSADGRKLYLAVVNRSRSENALAKIQLKGWQMAGLSADAYVLNGKSWDAANPFGATDQVDVTHASRPLHALNGSSFTYEFPAHSATILEIEGLQLAVARNKYLLTSTIRCAKSSNMVEKSRLKYG